MKLVLKKRQNLPKIKSVKQWLDEHTFDVGVSDPLVVTQVRGESRGRVPRLSNTTYILQKKNVTRQLRNSLVVHPRLRKILEPSLHVL